MNTSDEPDLQEANKWYGKGKQLYDAGDYKEAMDCFRKALTIEPEYAYAWYKLALSEDHLGNLDKAIYSYHQVIEFAIYETELIDRANKRLAELESNNHRSLNDQEKITGMDPKPDQNMPDLSTGASYQPDDVIGQKYEVHSILGKGGFGVVYLVYVHQTGDVFALKTFREEYLNDTQTRDLFRKEAGIWVELERHPYLVRAFFVDEISGRLFIGMEYIAPNERGLNTLDGYLQLRPPGLAQSLRWAIQICHGMEYAYSKGIRAHRDIKPANIMISQDGTAKITDFGLASVLGAPLAEPKNELSTRKEGIILSEQTQEGIGFGTPTHMPPEQFDNAANCDERSDIYAFGVMLFQMSSGGWLPFNPPPPSENSEQDMASFFRTMRRFHREASVPQLDSPIFPIIQRCMEKNPSRRYQSFNHLRLELESLLKCQAGEMVRLPQLGELEAWELCNKGVSLNHLGRFEEAISCSEKVLELESRNPIAWNNKGISLNHLGRYEEALHCFEKALELNARDLAAWTNKGACFDSMSRYEEAIHCYDQALQLDRNYGDIWNNKGNSLYKAQRYDEAIHCYNQGLNLNPRNATAWNNKGIILDHLGRYDEAIQCDDQSLKLDPCDLGAWASKGSCLAKLGRSEEAIRCYNQALELDPSNISTWYNKGISLDSLGCYEEAIHCYDHVLELNPHDARAWYNKGTNLTRFGSYEEAIRCFDSALILDPCYIGAWINKGSCLDSLGHHEEAIICHNQVLKLDPHAIEAWINKGNSLGSLGDHVEAIRCYDQALKLDPRVSSAWGGKGIAQAEIGRRGEAVQSFRQFLKFATAQQTDLIDSIRQRIIELEGN